MIELCQEKLLTKEIEQAAVVENFELTNWMYKWSQKEKWILHFLGIK
jgi:hypothetical protein